ncbi:MAG TPA: phosphate signaling complex protein PhoU [Pirellulaceae bacterium]|nr:phosphate signaling complex protein PhoU [Planctomycetales bacterium]MCB9938406.1 phosphate signaling complex protein PhoU [Planctomycetaceae bacterium]HRX79074.1 phosphate signaling complex protein PhoU [Pirellulaceae bacterium]
MTKHLQRDLDAVYHDLLSMSTVVEEMIDQAALALIERQYELAAKVIAADEAVDRREVKIEEECLKILALHQPVAIDLRRIASVIKINNDLERIADLAVNVAQRSLSLDEFLQFPVPQKVSRMVSLVTQMVRGSLDAFVNLDTSAAKRIMSMDQTIDELNVEVIGELQALMQDAPNLVVPALHCFSASRHIERIGDHATNIAEDVVYLVAGDIVRHKSIESRMH